MTDPSPTPPTDHFDCPDCGGSGISGSHADHAPGCDGGGPVCARRCPVEVPDYCTWPGHEAISQGVTDA